ncbi:MAG TPA: reverse transcriptase family protein [Acidimicrobiales bacterium]|nr:reverse transcriptase family protein [Acidimicrobiales bacterium]
MTRGRLGVVVADGLARAFLAGDWDPEAMARRGHRCLGDRRRWVFHLASAARSGWPEAPADAPRALAAFLAACPVLTEALARDRALGRPAPQVRHWFPTDPAMGPARWPVPELASRRDLQELLGLDAGGLAWFADARSWERTVPDERLRHYRYRWSAKAAGGVRLIEEPKPTLKFFQRRLLRDVLNLIPPHPAAHGFRPGHSVLTHARLHAGQAAVLRFDLEAFFSSVAAGRIYGLFRTAGYPEAVAHSLTALVTNAVPRSVWHAAPKPDDGPGLAAHHRLGRHLAGAHLPQGAPTSPALANLVAFGLDRRLSGLAAANGARYSRYADDLTFSGPHRLWRRAPALTRVVAGIVAEEGFRLNPDKTSRRAAGERQLVTGLVVNAEPNVRRSEYETLKAIVHNAARTGGEGQNREGQPDFRAHLAGRVAWLTSVHPHHGAKLWAEFETIDW